MVKPSTKLILAITNENNGVLSSIHHGLSDVSLRSIFPFITLDETLAFAIGSYHDRCYENRIGNPEMQKKYSDMIDHMNLHEIFQHYFSCPIRPLRTGNFQSPYNTIKNAFAWMKSGPKVQGKDKKHYDEMNHTKISLIERLNNIDQNSSDEIKKMIKTEPNVYVFECQYNEMKRRLQTNKNIRIMEFQNVYPRKDNIAKNYAQEIARIFRAYPQESFL